MIDHLVLATGDLERTVATIARDWGVTPTPGGAHLGRGTRNELVALGDGAYLEIIGPDLQQADHVGDRPFGVRAGASERLVAWCARPDGDLDSAHEAAKRCGHDAGPIATMSRRRPDGVVLEWQLTMPLVAADRHDRPALLPFMIDWLQSSHPTLSLHHDVQLVKLLLHTSHPEQVVTVIEAIGPDHRITVHASADDDDRLVAHLHTPAGPITLSSEID